MLIALWEKLASPAPIKLSCLRRCCAGRGTTRVPPSASEYSAGEAVAPASDRRDIPRSWPRWCNSFRTCTISFSSGKLPGNLRVISSNKGPEISIQSAEISWLGQVVNQGTHGARCTVAPPTVQLSSRAPLPRCERHLLHRAAPCTTVQTDFPAPSCIGTDGARGLHRILAPAVQMCS